MSYQKHVWVTQEIIRGVNLNHIENGIYEEEHRAIAAEQSLSDRIDNERTRASNVESNLSNRISSNENAITTLNADATVTGSVDNKLTSYVLKTDLATTSTAGVVQPDGSSISISNGVISTSKSNIGLENVPNVSTNNQTPTYTEATSLTALTSGEKLSVAFGKLAKAVSSLISHLADTNNPHSVTKAQVGLDQVGNYKAVSTEASQGLTTDEKTNARTNIGAGTSSLALGTSSSTAYRGDRGNIAYTHSQKTSGNPHNVTAADVGLGNVGNFKAVSTVADQGLTEDEKAAARANIGAGSASGTGTVTSVATGAGLTGGTITTSGTLKANLKSETLSTLTAASKGTTSSREYAVGLDANGNLSVNVPWTGTVKKVSTGVGLTGGNITSTGTIKAYLMSEESATQNAIIETGTRRQYAVVPDYSGYLSVNVPWTDTRDFKTGTTVATATNNTLYFVYTT